MTNTYAQEKKSSSFQRPLELSATTVNMIGVVLFYVIVFVAVNVFYGQI